MPKGLGFLSNLFVFSLSAAITQKACLPQAGISLPIPISTSFQFNLKFWCSFPNKVVGGIKSDNSFSFRTLKYI
jgi:hypothetical protein